MRRNRIKEYFLKTRESEKDNEGNAHDVYGDALSFRGEVWPASGKVQAEIYGERLTYIRNAKVEGNYIITTDRKNVVHYVYPDGLDIVESDGLCLYVPQDADPDYKVLSIKPYQPLRMEAIKR